MNTNIRDSVGDTRKGAVNHSEDVRAVQGLLNVQIVKDSRSDRLLAVDGRIGSDVLRAVGEFQREHGLSQTELIKPGDSTIRALASFNTPHTMRTSQAGVDLIKRSEQFNFKLYDRDGSAGNTTIGWGHLVHLGNINHSSSEDQFKKGIGQAEADRLLRADLAAAEAEVNSSVQVPPAQGQFDALVSLAFNLPPGRFKGSTLLKILNLGDYVGALKEFDRFVQVKNGSGGYEVSRGLQDRRRREEELFRRRR